MKPNSGGNQGARGVRRRVGTGSRSKLLPLLDAFESAAALLDERGHVLACNSACRELFAVRSYQEIGQFWQRSGDARERAALEGALRDMLGSSQPVTVDQHLNGPDGFPVVIRWSLGPLDIDISGGPARALAVVVRGAERSVLAREQAALFRVTRAIAGETSPVSVFHIVAEEAARLLNADIGSLVRFVSRTELVTLASWTAGGIQGMPPYGTILPMNEGSATEQVAQTGRPARMSAYTKNDSVTTKILLDAGAQMGVSSPVFNGGELWGCVSVAWTDSHPLGDDEESLLSDFAELVTMALEAAERRELLAIGARTDSLTGLPNHRAFQDRLQSSVAHARRTGGSLAIVMLDLDFFKTINDTCGHQTGDGLLADVAARLLSIVRGGELVARVGGDEFAVLLPDATMALAEVLASRAIATIRAISIQGIGGVTCSAGVCDLEHAADAGELYRFADGALYWAKEHGRDQVRTYLLEVVTDLSAQDQVDRLTRSQKHSALLALARAIDARDPATQRHSERVAEIAALLAEEVGWSAPAIVKLRDAALLHDVGKIGIPDTILFKPGTLLSAEYNIIKQHADLGARITGDVLDADQVEWIRHHHERWDGKGYPNELVNDAIPEGAQLLAISDAWDVMVSGRNYKAAMTIEESLAEMKEWAGVQFSPKVVALLPSVIYKVGTADSSRQRN